MKSFLLRSVIGIGIGAILSVFITMSIVVFGNESMLDGDLYVKNAWGSLLCGWFFAVAAMIFEMKKLALWQQTLIHFIFITVLYFIFANWIGWIPYHEGVFLTMIAAFVFVYLIMWLSFYLYFKRQASKMNENLERL